MGAGSIQKFIRCPSCRFQREPRGVLRGELRVGWVKCKVLVRAVLVCSHVDDPLRSITSDLDWNTAHLINYLNRGWMQHCQENFFHAIRNISIAGINMWVSVDSPDLDSTLFVSGMGTKRTAEEDGTGYGRSLADVPSLGEIAIHNQ